MPVKTTLIALGAAVAFSASVLAASSSCHAAADTAATTKYFERSIHGSYALVSKNSDARPVLITASGSSSGHGGYLIHRVAARYHALAKWRILAGKYYGPGATRWTLATSKSVICDAHDTVVTCSVSAHPANLLQRLGLTSS